MKVHDLNEDWLNYWFGKTEGLRVEIIGGQCHVFDPAQESADMVFDWAFIGELIEKDIQQRPPGKLGLIYEAVELLPCLPDVNKSLLRAVKLCAVKRKYGETVEVVTPREDEQC